MENSFFNVRHVTQFRYNAPVREAVMELYLQPRTDDRQRLRTFEISIAPHGQLFGYSDYMGNAVYHFDVPTAHDLLEIVMQATVEVTHAAALPDTLEGVSWTQAREVATDHDRWEMTQNSQFARPSEALLSFIGETGLSASGDVLTALRTLTQTIYDKFRYVSDATSADSPIEEALASGEGVCQDFA
ncbi:MAG: transglutaminase N-terminal domain-containing protein, partial [Pseudomonadota bacterium]